MNMTLTEHERREWRRTEAILRERGCISQADVLREALYGEPGVPIALFDHAGQIYRDWLCFDEPKGKSMYHLTDTGYHAGRPFCPVDKRQALADGQQFIHAVMANLDDDGNAPAGAPWADICPECKAEWARAVKEDE